MIYQYKCDCGKEQDKDYAMGKAPQSVKCKCGKRAHRSYSMTVSVPDALHISG